MTKFLLTVIGLAVIGFLIIQDKWRVVFDTTNYQVSISFVLFVVGLFVVLWMLHIIQKPFEWMARFREWRKSKDQAAKEAFFPELLTTLLSHETDTKPGLLARAKKIYGSQSPETLLITALLKPDSQTFQELNEADETKLAGLYGLVQEAEKLGDLDEVSNLLEQVPPHLQKTPWVRMTKDKLALQRNDWGTALRLLEENKKYMPKDVYRSHKACLLCKLGEIKKAYHLTPENPAIALMYAKVEPKKARSILEKAWNTTPGWPIYPAYKDTLKGLPDTKRLKAVLALTKRTRDQRYSLLARADMDAELQNWARAKESLDIYLQNYPLTRQVADMMANVERVGYHHEELAQEWERKAIESEDDSLWMCLDCNHTVGDWQVLCPHCNAFDRIVLK